MEINVCGYCKIIPDVETFKTNLNGKDILLYGITCNNPKCKCRRKFKTKLYTNKEEAINEWNHEKSTRKLLPDNHNSVFPAFCC